tara:strand:- start:483 stop:608 length:126 start_codon:yes stop_codon:yes gene_type:complete
VSVDGLHGIDVDYGNIIMQKNNLKKAVETDLLIENLTINGN